MKRVVVTGVGAISPLGNSLRDSWDAVKAGISGIAAITRFDVTAIKWKVAGELKGFDETAYLTSKEINRLDPFVHYAVAAALMASEDAELHTRKRRHYVSSGAIMIGSSRGGISYLEKEFRKQCSLQKPRTTARTSPYLMPSTTISMASSYVAQKLGIKGYCLGISHACSSGTGAIGEAYRLIKAGHEGPVFCGGTEAPLCRICIEGYGSSGSLSRITDSTASRPFDKTRDGFVLSEGACIVVLEDYEQAVRRGVKIYGEIIGYGNTTDAFHQTMPSPEGEARAIKSALDEAGLKREEIDFINAHGTATKLGDEAETKAIKMSCGKSAYHIPITSVKSMTGHMLAASGALEAAFTLLSMNEGVIPPTINLMQKDPACDLDYVTEMRNGTITNALSHSFGFGGVNTVLIFRRVKN
jgi:3-oxoacyl-[acyl-carrier-protein] synthase II